jgi:hypothetical protein
VKLVVTELVKKFPGVHKSALLDLILSQMNPVHTHTHTIPLSSVLILFFYLGQGLPNGFFPSGFPTKSLYAFLITTMRDTCLAYLIPLDIITLAICGEEYDGVSKSLRTKS